jgi:hypothetical protein
MTDYANSKSREISVVLSEKCQIDRLEASFREEHERADNHLDLLNELQSTTVDRLISLEEQGTAQRASGAEIEAMAVRRFNDQEARIHDLESQLIALSKALEEVQSRSLGSWMKAMFSRLRDFLGSRARVFASS